MAIGIDTDKGTFCPNLTKLKAPMETKMTNPAQSKTGAKPVLKKEFATESGTFSQIVTPITMKVGKIATNKQPIRHSHLSAF
jgi:hypothetical protein